MAKKLVLHVGTPKTGTSTIQGFMRTNRALLAKRRANIARLKERLAALDGTRLRFLSEHPEESTLYFPVYLENGL